MSSINLTVNGIPVTVPKGTKMIDAAKKVNVLIPTLCDHPDLCKQALCRICVVECDGSSKLMPACANDVWEGVKIVTNNLRILDTRKTILELIIANHPRECLSCVKNKKCTLQTLAADFNILDVPFEPVLNESTRPKEIIETGKNEKGEGVTLVRDMDKCVKCCRCVEVCQVVEKNGAINTSSRSKDFKITTPYKQSLKESNCNFCGKCADVCPVAAIWR